MAEKEEMIVEEKPEELDGRFFALTTWIWIGLPMHWGWHFWWIRLDSFFLTFFETLRL